MMSKRNLLALMPPGSQLTNRGSIAKVIEPDNPVLVVTLSQHTLKEDYALRRQSRTVAYRKQREDFFEGKTTPQRAAVRPSVSAQATPKPLRSPSRYLQALWKFEPERKAIVRLMYPDFKDTGVDSATDKIEIPLKDILEPMVKLSNPEKKRYTYASASPTKDRCCSVCGKQFIKNDKKCVPRFAVGCYTN
jgi:hypothetical protein